MDYGRYFKLDPDASDIAAGIAIFRYCPDGETNSPVYAAFTSLGVEFNAVGPTTNSRVMHLPLDENLDEGTLESVLAEDFRQKVIIPEMRECATTKAADVDRRGYFAAYFNLGKGIKDPTHPWKLWTADKASLSLAKLVLDFLFDLRETRVFEMSPHYMEVNEKLRENFFFRALAAKAKYLYQRGVYAVGVKEAATHVGDGAKQHRADRRRFYSELFFEAEKEWTECIRDPRSSKTFHGSGGWFETCENEMKRVYKHWPRLWLDDAKMVKKKENDKLSSRWLAQRYDVGFAWRIWPFHPSFFGLHLLLPRVAANIAAGWFTLALMQDMKVIKSFEASHSGRVWFVFVMVVMMLGCSYIFIRRAVPFTKFMSVARRAAQLTVATLLISTVIGWGLWLMISRVEKDMSGHFVFFCVAAAFFATFINLFVQDKNPSEFA